MFLGVGAIVLLRTVMSYREFKQCPYVHLSRKRFMFVSGLLIFIVYLHTDTISGIVYIKSQTF